MQAQRTLAVVASGTVYPMDLLRPALTSLLGLPTPALNRIAGRPPTVEGRTLDAAVNFLLYAQSRLPDQRTHDVGLRRASLREDAALVMPQIPGVDVQSCLLAERIPARVYRAAGPRRPAPTLVYFHGGGWVVGDLDTHDGSCRMLALHSGCVVVSVDYRLAPEHPFPAGLQDAVDAFDDVCANAREFGGIPQAVAVGGDSAGGNLAAALCLQRSPLAAALIYPATDLRMEQPSITTFGEGFFLTREDMLWYRQNYLQDLDLVTDPRVSPLLAEDLSAFPPTAIWTAGFDPLVDEGMAFARRLAQAGVAVHSHCFTDQIHGFFGMGLLPRGMERIARVGRETGRLITSAMG